MLSEVTLVKKLFKNLYNSTFILISSDKRIFVSVKNRILIVLFLFNSI